MNDRKRLLIVDGDEGFLSECRKNLSTDFSIVGIARDGEEAIRKIRESRPDAVLLELLLSKYDGCRVISEFVSEKGAPVFVVATGINNMQMMSEASDCGAAFCVKKPLDFASLSERIRKLCDRKNKIPKERDIPENLELQVTEIMHKIGVPANIKGHAYLRTAIMMAVNDPEMIRSMTKVLYPTVAKSYGTNAYCVERNIRHAIETAWERGDMDTLNSIFGYTVQLSRGKPTCGEFIALVADDLRLKNR